MQSEPITTQIVGSNLDSGEVHSIQHYVMMFISDLRQIQYLVVITITVAKPQKYWEYVLMVVTNLVEIASIWIPRVHLDIVFLTLAVKQKKNKSKNCIYIFKTKYTLNALNQLKRVWRYQRGNQNLYIEEE
jgi:hypothetical protein